MSVFLVILYSGLYFPAFGLNTERYGASFCIQSECGKIWTRITPNTDTFHAVTLINKNTFTFWWFVCKERNNYFSKSSIIRNFFVSKLLKYEFLVFPKSFLQKFAWFFSLKNLFLNLDLFMIVTCSYLVIKGASFARRYLIGACLLKMWKIESLKKPKCTPLEQRLWASDL